jgi:hypothetical protein
MGLRAVVFAGLAVRLFGLVGRPALSEGGGRALAGAVRLAELACAGCQDLQRRLRDLQAENDRLRPLPADTIRSWCARTAKRYGLTIGGGIREGLHISRWVLAAWWNTARRDRCELYGASGTEPAKGLPGAAGSNPADLLPEPGTQSSSSPLPCLSSDFFCQRQVLTFLGSFECKESPK